MANPLQDLTKNNNWITPVAVMVGTGLGVFLGGGGGLAGTLLGGLLGGSTMLALAMTALSFMSGGNVSNTPTHSSAYGVRSNASVPTVRIAKNVSNETLTSESEVAVVKGYPEALINEQRKLDHLLILANAQDIMKNRPRTSKNNDLGVPVTDIDEYKNLAQVRNDAQAVSSQISEILSGAEHNLAILKLAKPTHHLSQNDFILEKKKALLANETYRDILSSVYQEVKGQDINQVDLSKVSVAEMYNLIEQGVSARIQDKRTREWSDSNWATINPISNWPIGGKIRSAIVDKFDKQDFAGMHAIASENDGHPFSRYDVSQAAKQDGRDVVQKVLVEESKQLIEFDKLVQLREQLYKDKADFCRQCISVNATEIAPSLATPQTGPIASQPESETAPDQKTGYVIPAEVLKTLQDTVSPAAKDVMNSIPNIGNDPRFVG